jgi:hypothetical protein
MRAPKIRYSSFSLAQCIGPLRSVWLVFVHVCGVVNALAVHSTLVCDEQADAATLRTATMTSCATKRAADRHASGASVSGRRGKNTRGA